MKTLKLAEGLTLPLDVVTQTIAILAKRRAGKSYTMRRLVEQLFKAGQQVVLVDPKGDQWGIRSAADGKGPGLPIVILGGERGDVPLEVGSGEVVAKLVVEERVSALLDLSQFRKHELATFMTAFLENLYRLKAREQYRTPVMLVIDEADAVAPQKPPKGHERMLGAAEDIVRRGGQRGIGCVLVTQRSAVLNKNVLTQAQMLVVLRTIAPQDLKAMEAWVEVHGDAAQGRTLMASLPALPIGDAWFWSPGWPTAEGIFTRAHVLPIETFDSGASPKPGVKPVEPKHLADVDLQALKGQMAATIEKAKADDPRELRKALAEKDRRISELERATSGSLHAVQGAAKTVEVLTDADREMLRAVAARLGTIPGELSGHLRVLLSGVMAQALDAAIAKHEAATERARAEFVGLVDKKGVARILEKLDRVSTTTERQALISPPRPQLRISPSINPSLTRPGPTRDAAVALATHVAATDGITPVQQRILNALAELEQLGARQPARELVAFMANYTHLQSKGFVNAMSSLSTAGCITYGAGTVALTDAGRAAAHAPEAPRTPKDVQDRVIAMLGGASGRILAPLIEAYPKALPRQAVAERAGYGHLQSKGFVNAISRLRTLGFVDYPDRGSIVAKPVLFLEA